jgi:hypothetical protein
VINGQRVNLQSLVEFKSGDKSELFSK